MFYVYILLSKKDNKRYIGMTANLNRRLSEHNSGLVKSTKNRMPLDLIHYEIFETKSEAHSFERKLKQRKGNLDIQQLKDNLNYRLSLLKKS
mgnify:CR=1 FL=1